MVNQTTVTGALNRSRQVMNPARRISMRTPALTTAMFLVVTLAGGCAATQPILDQMLADVRALNDRLVARLGKLEDTGLEVREVDDRVMIVVPDVFFNFGESKLSGDARAAISEVAALLDSADYGQHGIEIEGYTDAVGSDAYNLALSEKRARAVEEELLFSALKADRIREVRGMGEANPVQPNTRSDGSDNPEGRAKNRRVEIVIIDPRMTAGN